MISRDNLVVLVNEAKAIFEQLKISDIDSFFSEIENEETFFSAGNFGNLKQGELANKIRVHVGKFSLLAQLVEIYRLKGIDAIKPLKDHLSSLPSSIGSLAIAYPYTPGAGQLSDTRINPRTEDKIFELFVGLSALKIGNIIAVDNQSNNSNVKTPDLVVEIGNEMWAIECKVLGTSKESLINIYNLTKDAIDKIESYFNNLGNNILSKYEECKGIVVFNLRNQFPHQEILTSNNGTTSCFIGDSAIREYLENFQLDFRNKLYKDAGRDSSRFGEEAVCQLFDGKRTIRWILHCVETVGVIKEETIIKGVLRPIKKTVSFPNVWATQLSIVKGVDQDVPYPAVRRLREALLADPKDLCLNRMAVEA